MCGEKQAGGKLRGSAVPCALLLIASVVGSAALDMRCRAQAGHAHGLDDGIYAYTDDRGGIVYANRLQDVPVQLRPYARRVDRTDSSSSDDPGSPVFDWSTPARDKADATPAFYRYRSPGGRMTYTNLADNVPVAQRPNAKIDLEQVPINSKLGVEIDQQLKTQYDKLRDSRFCKAIQAAVNESFWQRAWSEHAPLVVCGGAILVFLLATPFMVRKFGGVPWARALSTAIPAFAFTGLVSFLIVKSGNAMDQLRERALPCDPNAWNSEPGAPDEPASNTAPQSPLVKHLRMVSALKTETQMLERINAESR